jgi:hypothetical protein
MWKKRSTLTRMPKAIRIFVRSACVAPGKQHVKKCSPARPCNRPAQQGAKTQYIIPEMAYVQFQHKND